MRDERNSAYKPSVTGNDFDISELQILGNRDTVVYSCCKTLNADCAYCAQC